jgi:CheY-like chemotaxis protein
MSARTSARVLVVERDEDLRRSTAEVLAAAGYQVRAAGDSAGALAAAAELRPEVALVHVGLADGWELVRALRNDPVTRACPIVATGGRPLATYAREPMLAEVEAYLMKPSEPEFLLAVLVGALGGGGVAERASREMHVIPTPTDR